MLTSNKPLSGIKDGHQGNARGVDHDFALIAEVNGYLVSDVRLHLPQTPIRVLRMAYKRTGRQKRVECHQEPRELEDGLWVNIRSIWQH